MRDPLDALFNPTSIAVIGASANPAKMGNIALRNLVSGRLKVFPVNPGEKEILGMRCYRSVADIEDEVDIGLISLPAPATIGPARECVQKKIPIVIVTASGFRETGREGRRLEQGLIEAIGGSGTRLVGPNTMGAFVPSVGLDTFFIPKERSPRPEAGSVFMMAQSGAVSVAFLERAASTGLGVFACVGLGNKADLNENDFLSYARDCDSVGAVALYLESFSDGREFFRTASELTKRKPVVVLKSGRTKAGLTAASSHTGAIAAASDAMVDGALRQAGAARVYDEEELVDVVKALAWAGCIRGDRICVVASAGGFGVIAADFVESGEHGTGLRMAKISEDTKRRIRSVVPGFSSVGNPVDLTAAVTDAQYEIALEAIQSDPGVDGVMMSLELQPPNVTMGLIEVAARRFGASGSPIVVSLFGGRDTDKLLAQLGRKGVPAYPTIWRSIRALRALSERGHYLEHKKTLSEDTR